jgi:hypothetical protein
MKLKWFLRAGRPILREGPATYLCALARVGLVLRYERLARGVFVEAVE